MKGHSLGLFGITNKYRLATFKLVYSQVSTPALLTHLLPRCHRVYQSEACQSSHVSHLGMTLEGNRGKTTHVSCQPFGVCAQETPNMTCPPPNR